jgi:hypothetical protein
MARIIPRLPLSSCATKIWRTKAGGVMPWSRTDVRPELTSFVRAMRRHASRTRRLAPHGKTVERLRVLADYLDARADALEATPVQVRLDQPQQSVGDAPARGQRLLAAVLAMLS